MKKNVGSNLDVWLAFESVAILYRDINHIIGARLDLFHFLPRYVESDPISMSNARVQWRTKRAARSARASAWNALLGSCAIWIPQRARLGVKCNRKESLKEDIQQFFDGLQIRLRAARPCLLYLPTLTSVVVFHQNR